MSPQNNKFKLGLSAIFSALLLLTPVSLLAEESSAPTSFSSTTPSGNTFVHEGSQVIKSDKYVARLSTEVGSKLGYAELPAFVLANTDFNDIRLLNSDGKEIPYLLKKGDDGATAYVEKTIEGEMSNVIVRTGKTEFTIDLGSDVLPHNKLKIETQTDNFSRNVSVYGSDKMLPLEDSSWGLITKEKYIYSYNDSKAGVYASDTTVQYPVSTFRYLKVVVDRDKNQPEVSVSVSGATAILKEAGNDKTIVSDIQNKTNIVRSRILDTKQNAEKKTTEVYLDIGSTGIVVSSLSMKIEGNNFTRKVVVQGSNSADLTKGWNTLGSDTIHKIDAKLYQGEKTDITLSQKRFRYLRIIIENNDSLPVEVTGVDVTTIPDFVIFNNNVPANNLSYVDVYFGGEKVKAPTYDLGGELTYGTKEQFALFSTDKLESNPFYSPYQPVVPWSERNSWAINTAVVVLAIIIGSFVYMYVRKVAGTTVRKG